MDRSDRTIFLNLIEKEFPEAVLEDEYSDGLLHCEIANFRLYLEECIEEGKLWMAEKGFRLIEKLLESADSKLKNAIEISFLYDFAIGEQTEKQIVFVKNRTSKKIQEILREHSPEWG